MVNSEQNTGGPARQEVAEAGAPSMPPAVQAMLDRLSTPELIKDDEQFRVALLREWHDNKELKSSAYLFEALLKHKIDRSDLDPEIKRLFYKIVDIRVFYSQVKNTTIEELRGINKERDDKEANLVDSFLLELFNKWLSENATRISGSLKKIVERVYKESEKWSLEKRNKYLTQEITNFSKTVGDIFLREAFKGFDLGISNEEMYGLIELAKNQYKNDGLFRDVSHVIGNFGMPCFGDITPKCTEKMAKAAEDYLISLNKI